MLSTVISERRLASFLRHQLGVKEEVFQVDKEAGVLWVTGGAGKDVTVMPADPETWFASEVVSERLIRFPLLHGEFRIEGSDGTDLRVHVGMEVEVSGVMGSTVAEALGVRVPQVLAA